MRLDYRMQNRAIYLSKDFIKDCGWESFCSFLSIKPIDGKLVSKLYIQGQTVIKKILACFPVSYLSVWRHEQ